MPVTPPGSETVLFVDDDPSIRRVIGEFLRRSGFEVFEAASGEEGVAAFRQERPDVVLLDINMPGRSGLDVFDEIRQDGAVVIFLTGVADVATAVRAMQLGAEHFLTKPVDLPHLVAAVARAAEKSRLRREVQRLRGRAGQVKLDESLGVSPGMRAIEREIAAVADSERTTVLIVGESGTGKGRVAQMIHALSPRARGPFVAINCGGLTATFLNDELFGHERGAFTDAKESKEGLFEVAAGGSVFLDEVGDLPAEVQPKLLTVLDTRKFRRLGGTREITADARLIAATNRPIEQAVAAGAFREDLYYRIAVSIIRLPPVRDRTREDRLHLIHQMIAELAGELRGAPTDVTSDALERLLGYPWPGNVREMRNVLERAMIMARTADAIRVDHLPGELRGRRAAKVRRVAPLEHVERDHIAQALALHDGNRTRAARDLGISRVTLLKKIEKYGL
ncbi:MAG TPA: sigma-54 dependent transcriptional regulator [Gemmatimonadales bacterium]|nr:sigma-54 dependent transcriptional regulator [Gemmatimonadales bacterium]